VRRCLTYGWAGGRKRFGEESDRAQHQNNMREDTVGLKNKKILKAQIKVKKVIWNQSFTGRIQDQNLSSDQVIIARREGWERQQGGA